MKQERQRAILKLISESEINTQSELVDRLAVQGFKATQATVSRDIKEIGLIKVPAGKKRYRYSTPPQHKIDNVFGRLKRMFQDSVVEFDSSENLILIKTLPGTAQAVASCIDNMEWEDLLGTVAGDDAILVIAKTTEKVDAIKERFSSLSD
ncbi:MAG: arginine repressor [Clostridia bacterium]|nr:arginine repressor [Clostridia bacterium]